MGWSCPGFGLHCLAKPYDLNFRMRAGSIPMEKSLLEIHLSCNTRIKRRELNARWSLYESLRRMGQFFLGNYNSLVILQEQ